jgi:High potential iron-sulfur protein
MPNNDRPVQPISKPEPGLSTISRRQVLRGVSIAAGGAAVLLAAGSPAEAKMTQVAAAYQEKPKGDQSCATCALFKAPSSCTLVEGTISPNGWCRFYTKKS